jgi:hypothetical protein
MAINDDIILDMFHYFCCFVVCIVQYLISFSFLCVVYKFYQIFVCFFGSFHLFIFWFSQCRGPPISFSSSSTFSGSNLIWSTNGLDIFVNCSRSDELFIGFSFVNEFLELPPPKCNPNLFDHFFNPYIYLNLEEFCILVSPYFSLDPIVHLAIIVVVSFTSGFVLCLTFIIASCAHDYVLSFTTNVFVSSSSSKLILVSNSCDFMVFGAKLGEGTNLKSSIRDVSKSYFLDLNEKEVENVNKASQRINKHVELLVKNAFDEWNFFVVLIQQDQLLIFQRMNLLLRIWLSFFIL